MFIAAIVLFDFGVSLASHNGDALATKENKLLTAQLLVNEIRKNIKTYPIDAEFLYKELKSNIKTHQNLQDSRRICREIIEAHLLKKYKKEVIQILERLDIDKPENIKSWFDQKEREKFLKPEKVAQESIDKHFEQAFKKARRKVCKEQITRLIGDVYPTEKEIETVGRAQLRQQLLERLIKKQKEPLYAENRPLLSKNIVDPVLNDAYEQKNQQLRIVDKSTGGNAITPADIQAFTENKLKKYRETLRELKAAKKDSGKIYKVFPSVEKQIRARSEQIAAKKFAQRILYSTFPVGYQKLCTLIKNNLPRHIHIEQSHQFFLNEFTDDIKKKNIDKYSQNVALAKREGFRIFLEQLIATNDECREAFKKSIKRSLNTNFRKAREGISKDQFHQYFSPLSSNSWRPGYDKIDSFYNKLQIKIPQPMSMESVSSKPFDMFILLDETRNMVVEAEKRQISEGLEALRKQMHIVEELEQHVKTELTNGSALPTIEGLIESFTVKVKSNWSSKVLADKYEKLFPRVQKDIERRSKALLLLENKRRSQLAEQTTKEALRSQLPLEQGKKLHQEEKKPELPKRPPLSGKSSTGIGAGGEGGGTHEGKEVKKGNVIPEIIIDLDYKEGLVISDLTFIAAELDSVQFVLSGDPDSDQKKLSEIQQIFKTWLKQAVTKDKDIHIHILTRIFNRRVYYGVVFDLRECMERAINRSYNRKTIIRWFDCLASKKDKEKLYIPAELKEKSMPLQK